MGTGENWNSRFGDGIRKIIHQIAKVGATAGWTVNAGVDTFMSTCAAGSTAATLVIPLPGLRVDDIITGFHLLGQIESAGNAATLDAALYEFVPAAAASAAAVLSGTSMTQISVTADAAIDVNNSKTEFTDANRVVVAQDRSYFALLTATTNASTDIELLGFVPYIKETN